MGTDHHRRILVYLLGFFHPKGMHTFTPNFFSCLTSWKLIKEKEEKPNACFALHQMTEHGKKELQQLGSKKKRCKAKGGCLCMTKLY